jgi:hypothetical protein
MRGKYPISLLLVMSVVAIFAAAGAHAQTKPKTPVTAASKGAFHGLSLGNQKVAAALYHAQSPGGSINGATPAGRPLTLEAIAAKRQSGQAWGQIFRELKAQGLVHEKSLGQVVARYQQKLDATPGLLASDTSGGRSNAYEVGSNGSAGSAVHGVGKGGK